MAVLRWIMRGLVGLAVLAGLAVAVVWYLAARSLPDYAGEVEVAGLGAPVEIVRDSHAVPHIFGQSDADVFYGLGYAHAQDRLWQMTMMRRAAQGRLSELFGARTVGVDDFLRRLNLHGLAQAAVEAQDEATKAALVAYAAGVNARLAELRARRLGRGAPEFFIFPAEIEPWTPADSLSIMKLMGLRLSGHVQNEVRRAQLSAILEPARLADFLPAAPGAGTIDLAAAELPGYRELFPTLPRRQAAASPRRPRDPLDPVPDPDLAGASNAWAAGPSRTATSASLLANDPHLGLTAPSIWYLARLELQSGPVVGGTIPGMPVVLVGRNARIAWGLTSSYLDDQDVFIEKLNPDNPDEYLTPEGFKPFRTEQTRIEVAGGETVIATLRWTENGPVIPGDRYDLASVTPPGHVAAIGWTALTEADTSMTAGVRLMQAASVREALDATALFVAPSQNLTVADAEHIALALIGAMPARDPRHQTKGRMPAPGWLPQNRWKGVLPQSDNPRVIDPPTGVVGNTNNKIIDRPFPRHVSFDWGDTQRIERLKALMQGRPVHTLDSFIGAQQDAVSFAARTLLPLIGRDLWFTDATPLGSPAERLRAEAMKRLANWTGEMNEHMAEPLIYAAWLRQLGYRLARDELGPLMEAFPRPDPVFIERVFRNTGGAAAWCDVVQTTRKESCTEIARAALDDALAELAAKYGDDIDRWRWGDAHRAVHRHEVLGDIPVLSGLVNIVQSTSGGDHTLLRARTSGSGAEPFENVHAAGFRGVYDLGDPDNSVFIISTGQSGHFLSAHYDDLAALWRRGEYIPVNLDPALARAGSVGTLRLVPKAGG